MKLGARWLVAMLVLGGALLVVWRCTRSSGDVESARPGIAESAPGADASPVIDERVAAVPSTQPGITATRALPAGQTQGTSQSAPAHKTIHGTLVAVRNGVVELPPSATFELSIGTSDSPFTDDELEVEVRDGKWTAQLWSDSDAQRFWVSSARVGDRAVNVIAPSDAFGIGVVEPIEVRVEFVPASLLHVVDEISGLELDTVRLERPSIDDRRLLRPPFDGWTTTIGADLRSPIDVATLPAVAPWLTQTVALLVGSPGYAWKRASVNLHTGGDDTVRLERGGEIVLVLNGRDPQLPLYLSLKQGDAADPTGTLYTKLPNEAPVHIDGLRPGDYTLVVGSGDKRMGPDQPLANGTTPLLSGGVATVVMDLAVVPKREKAVLGGIVLVPPEWKMSRLLVSLEALAVWNGDASRTRSVPAQRQGLDSGFELWTFQFEPLEVGRYKLFTFEPRTESVVDLPPPGVSDVRIVVPPPADLSVLVVDNESGQKLTGNQLHWLPRDVVRERGWISGNAEFDATSGRFRIHAPAYPIELSWNDPEYADTAQVVDVHPGPQDITLSVHRSCGIVVHCLDGDTPVNSQEFWRTNVRGADEQHAPETHGTDGHGFRVRVSAPGAYRVQLPELTGYEPVDELSVLVEPGKFSELTVRLVRKAH